MNPEALKARMTRLVPNAFLDIIAINDSAKLELTADQIAKLQASGDAFKIKADSLVDKVANILGDTTVKSPDPMTIFAKLQPSMADGRKLATQAISEAEAILTPDQWAKVPEGVKDTGLATGRRRGRGRKVRASGSGERVALAQADRPPLCRTPPDGVFSPILNANKP